MNTNKKYSVNDILKKAEELMETLQPELAEKFFLKALSIEPNNTKIMDSYATLLLDMDELEKAKEFLLKSIQLSPNNNYTKYMQIAQLSEGKEALHFFNKGIELMIKEKEILEKNLFSKEEELQLLNRQISIAFCSMAEIYLTDACYEENAELECEKLLNQALLYDSNNPEVYQTFASFKLSQQKFEEALQFHLKGYSLWKDLDYEEKPSYEFRHNTAKLFLEMEKYENSIEIWESLIEEQDNIAEVHYFLGLAYRNINTNTAKECVSKAKELLIISKCEDKPLMEDIDTLIQQLQSENIEKDLELMDVTENQK